MSTREALRAVATDQVQRRQKTIFDYLDDPRVKSGLAAVAGKFLSPDRMLKLCVNAVKKTPLLLQCDPQTVLGAMMTTAALGLEPNTIQQLAFLIPYKRRAKVGTQWVDVYDCQFQVGARGFVTLAYRSPRVKALRAEAIHEGDTFEHMMGSENFLRYSKALKGRGELIGAFSHVNLVDGFETACVLPLEELEKIRSKSETFRALLRNVDSAENDKDRARAEQKLQETPWVMWADDMAAKSAIKKHAKQLPISSSDALMAAAELDSRSDVAALDLKTLVDPDAVRAVVGGEMDPPALEHNPSETLELGEIEHEHQHGERVQVPVSEAGADAARNRAEQEADAFDGPPAGHPAAQEEREEAQATRAPAPARSQRQQAGKGADAPSYAKLAERIGKCSDRDTGMVILDEARALPQDQQRELARLLDDRFPQE
ncbi:MAG TPA: recombinase RecT [Ramlibacter sp.]|uniref:recombinase RecT n=1 Tax=Ramlibacter sp. TaxID=1917967 RepID=UPI002D8093E2|nr:recombinase RecT [Ramlibacter sp.]HET8744629.1 recombinase RecT [Ramlibacter sp.]